MAEMDTIVITSWRELDALVYTKLMPHDEVKFVSDTQEELYNGQTVLLTDYNIVLINDVYELPWYSQEINEVIELLEECNQGIMCYTLNKNKLTDNLYRTSIIGKNLWGYGKHFSASVSLCLAILDYMNVKAEIKIK